MKAFTFVRPTTIEEASSAAAEKGSVIKAGGIDLLDRMKERVDEPERVVSLGDIKEPALRTIVLSSDGLRIGALVTLAEIAASPDVAKICPALSEAAGAAASPQIRARATLGGNLAQHTRCGYYRHKSFPCWKRGDESCPVLEDGAVQDTAAIFQNRPCASAHPSSLAPVLGACGAWISHYAKKLTDSPTITDLTGEEHVAPISVSERGKPNDFALPQGMLITSVRLPATGASRSVYEEVRQKAAFDWALVSCCARIEVDGDKVKSAGLWLGSVAPSPKRCDLAELNMLPELSDEQISRVVDAAVVGATPLPGNAYKVDLVKVVVRRALTRLRDMK